MGGNSLSVWNVGAFGLEGLLEDKNSRDQLEKGSGSIALSTNIFSDDSFRNQGFKSTP